MNETTNETPKKGNGLLIGFGIVALIALAAGAYFFLGTGENAPEETESETVATVDGTAIARGDLNRSTEQILNSYISQGVDVSGQDAEAAAQEQALNTLINRQLMLDAATEAGVTVSDEMVETEYQNTATSLGGAANLEAALSEAGMTEEDLRADLRKDILINTYLEQELGLQSLTVTDEEVEVAYNTAVEQSGEAELPALDEVREMIQAQLLAEKQQELIGAELERLRQEAEIEIMA